MNNSIEELEARSEYCSMQVVQLMTYGDINLPPLKEGVDRIKRLEFFIRYWEYQFSIAEARLIEIFRLLKSEKKLQEVYP